MSDYTPTTEEVRLQWLEQYQNLEIGEADFYRWITQHDREVAALSAPTEGDQE